MTNISTTINFLTKKINNNIPIPDNKIEELKNSIIMIIKTLDHYDDVINAIKLGLFTNIQLAEIITVLCYQIKNSWEIAQHNLKSLFESLKEIIPMDKIFAAMKLDQPLITTIGINNIPTEIILNCLSESCATNNRLFRDYLLDRINHRYMTNDMYTQVINNGCMHLVHNKYNFANGGVMSTENIKRCFEYCLNQCHIDTAADIILHHSRTHKTFELMDMDLFNKKLQDILTNTNVNMDNIINVVLNCSKFPNIKFTEKFMKLLTKTMIFYRYDGIIHITILNYICLFSKSIKCFKNYLFASNVVFKLADTDSHFMGKKLSVPKEKKGVYSSRFVINDVAIINNIKKRFMYFATKKLVNVEIIDEHINFSCLLEKYSRSECWVLSIKQPGQYYTQSLWNPSNHPYYPVKIQKAILGLCMALKYFKKEKHIVVPKPILFMINNMI